MKLWSAMILGASLLVLSACGTGQSTALEQRLEDCVEQRWQVFEGTGQTDPMLAAQAGVRARAECGVP